MIIMTLQVQCGRGCGQCAWIGIHGMESSDLLLTLRKSRSGGGQWVLLPRCRFGCSAGFCNRGGIRCEIEQGNSFTYVLKRERKKDKGK